MSTETVKVAGKPAEAPPAAVKNESQGSKPEAREWVKQIQHRSELRALAATRSETDEILFNLLAKKDRRVVVSDFWSALKVSGLRVNDFRLKETKANFDRERRKASTSEPTTHAFSVDLNTFKECIQENLSIITKAFKNDMVIPEFHQFIEKIRKIYDNCSKNTGGHPADYIPQLARVPPHYWGVSICTVDGQRYSFGDTTLPFCLQSTSKALNYALAVSDMGPAKVHQYVGQEPSGRSFNELTLDHTKKPHNPMINAGAIITVSLLKPDLQIADRFDYVQKEYKRMAGEEFVGFSNATYLSERETADRNFALAYYMRENDCFYKGADLTQTLEFYFQLCSVEVTAESASVIAATLANGGICPTTGQRVLAGDAVRNTLSLMHSCGMYDYSGQFAFKVGLPAKSGVAGAILLIIPNVMGICTWSPPLDDLGNSCRGVQFCEELVAEFNFHNYDNLKHTQQKMDPRKRSVDIEANAVVNLLFGATNGDVTAIRRFAMLDMNMGACDYDGRTALHLACAEGHLSVVKVLLEQCKVKLNPHDRWNYTPLDDAKKFGHQEIVDYLVDYEKKLKDGTLDLTPRRMSSLTLGPQ